MNMYMDAILYLKMHQSHVEMIYTPKYYMIYFLYFVYGTWMWVGVLAALVTLEEEYQAWVVFSHLLTPIPCIITRKLYRRS